MGEIIGGVSALAFIFFALINVLMFLSAEDYGWHWRCMVTIAVIDAFYILLFCAFLWAISTL